MWDLYIQNVATSQVRTVVLAAFIIVVAIIVMSVVTSRQLRLRRQIRSVQAMQLLTSPVITTGLGRVAWRPGMTLVLLRPRKDANVDLDDVRDELRRMEPVGGRRPFMVPSAEGTIAVVVFGDEANRTIGRMVIEDGLERQDRLFTVDEARRIAGMKALLDAKAPLDVIGPSVFGAADSHGLQIVRIEQETIEVPGDDGGDVQVRVKVEWDRT